MQNYNDNLAYDFELFSPKEKKAKIVELPESKNVRRTATGKASSRAAGKVSAKRVVSAVCVCAIVLGFIFLRLCSELESSELTAEINSAKTTLSELKSEQTRLQMEFENIVAYDNIEMAARELGMQKQEASQTVYVNAGDTDTAVVIDDSNGNGIFSLFADWF